MNSIQPVYIILRQSPDWAKQTYADLDKTRSFCKIIGRPENYIIDRVLLWTSRGLLELVLVKSKLAYHRT